MCKINFYCGHLLLTSSLTIVSSILIVLALSQNFNSTLNQTVDMVTYGRLLATKEDRLCLSNHQDKLLHSSALIVNTCNISCSFFVSTWLQKYYDSLENFQVMLDDNESCGVGLYCLRGQCTRQVTMMGYAELIILGAYLPGVRIGVYVDVKVHVFTQTPVEGTLVYLGRTIIAQGAESFYFGAPFISPPTDREGFFSLSVHNANPPAVITKFKILFDVCPRNEPCTITSDQYKLNYTLIWYNE